MPIDDALAQLGPSIKYEPDKSILHLHLDAEFIKVPSSVFPDELIEHYKLPELSLNLQNGLYVSKKKLQKTPEIIEVGKRLNINLQNRTSNYDFLGKINWVEAKQLVEEGLQSRMLTPALYFQVLKWAEDNNSEFAEDLKKNAEWLDAVTKEGATDAIARYIVHSDKDLNNGRDYSKILIPLDKMFDYADVDILSGLPIGLKENGKFKQYYPEKNPTAVVRNWYSELGLDCNGAPSDSNGVLGVRLIKFFP